MWSSEYPSGLLPAIRTGSIGGISGEREIGVELTAIGTEKRVERNDYLLCFYLVYIHSEVNVHNDARLNGAGSMVGRESVGSRADTAEEQPGGYPDLTAQYSKEFLYCRYVTYFSREWSSL